MSKLSLEELEKKYKNLSYPDFVEKIQQMIDTNKIKPVKAAGTNGKNPALPLRYWTVEDDVDYSEYIDEINNKFHISMSVDYYLTHLDQYVKDRDNILLLNRWLWSKSGGSRVSVNERSLEIWGYEKFCTQKGAKTLLKHVGLTIDDLNVYRTAEPIGYFLLSKDTPQNLIILENKDPFYGMRKYLLNDNQTILGVDIQGLIYGGGKGIIKAFKDADISLEQCMLNECNTFYYFGDLDFEGIRIYEDFADKHGDKYNIKPFIPAYLAMLNKADSYRLPATKEGQNRNIGSEFFSYFDDDTVKQMNEILNQGLYIPQEILTIEDYSLEV